MEKKFKEIEKIILDDMKNEDVNSLIQDDPNLFNYSDIKDIEEIFKIYKKILKLYKKSKSWMNKNISHIKVLMNMM